MNTSSTQTPLIVETRRGPCIAGTRITVFSVMDYLKGERSRDFIKHVMGISDEQLDAVLAYIILHKEAVEQDTLESCVAPKNVKQITKRCSASAHLSLHTCR